MNFTLKSKHTKFLTLRIQCQWGHWSHDSFVLRFLCKRIMWGMGDSVFRKKYFKVGFCFGYL